MKWDQVAGQWSQLKGRLKEQWGRLTDDDLDVAAGKFEQFVGTIQQKYGIAKEEAKEQIDGWLKDLDNNKQTASRRRRR